MKYRIALTLSALTIAPAAAQAQTTAPAAASATPAVGATVTGSDHGVIGTVKAVTPQAIVIDTGTNQVPVPPNSVGKDAKGTGWQMAMTKAQLDQAAEQQKAQLAAAVQAAATPGAQVHGASGAVLGTVKVADAQFITLTTAKGDAKLAAAAFSMGPSGLTIGYTQAQFDQVLSASMPAAQPTASATPAPSPGGK